MYACTCACRFDSIDSLNTHDAAQDAVSTAVAHASGQEYCECVCPANAPWRCDCSGLVSRAWGLGAPGLTTYALLWHLRALLLCCGALTHSCCSYDFNPNVCAKLGSRSELQPADALLWPGDPAAVSASTCSSRMRAHLILCHSAHWPCRDVREVDRPRRRHLHRGCMPQVNACLLYVCVRAVSLASSPSEGCTHGPKSLSNYGPEFFPCRAHADIVCP